MVTTADETGLGCASILGREIRVLVAWITTSAPHATTTTVTLTGPLGRLYVYEGNAVGNDFPPVDVALVGRDVDTLGLSPLLEALSRVDSSAEDSSSEEKGRCESFEGEQHGCCASPLSISPSLLYQKAPGIVEHRRNKTQDENTFEPFIVVEQTLTDRG